MVEHRHARLGPPQPGGDGIEAAEVVRMAVAEEERMKRRDVGAEVVQVLIESIASEPEVEEPARPGTPLSRLHQERQPVRAEGGIGPARLEHVAAPGDRALAALGARGEIAHEGHEAHAAHGLE